ncbi:MAG: FliH/SctL family protein [Janthinobacterium lividum]
MSARSLHPMVIPRQSLEAIRDATEIVAVAKQQAAHARHRAFQEGFAEGLKAAREQLNGIDRAIEAYWSEREQELITVALALAYRVVGEMPQNERLAGQVRTALAAHRADSALALRADPETATALQSLLGEAASAGSITVQSDPLLTSGNILLAHSQGQTEIGLVQQFRAFLTEADPRP